jgi:glycosyltransferase involved in cell wall biosynthesis
VPIKQQDLLLRGFQKALLTNSNLQLTVVGDGPELGKLKELSKKLAIQKKVCFKGKQTNEDVSKEMQKADIFILTSKRETFGVVLIEAMAVGLPCISTKSGGPEDILVNEDLGILCDQNSKAVCNAIIKAVKIEYNSESIRYHVSKTYSAEVVGTKIRSVYSKVITPQKNV